MKLVIAWLVLFTQKHTFSSFGETRLKTYQSQWWMNSLTQTDTNLLPGAPLGLISKQSCCELTERWTRRGGNGGNTGTGLWVGLRSSWGTSPPYDLTDSLAERERGLVRERWFASCHLSTVYCNLQYYTWYSVSQSFFSLSLSFTLSLSFSHRQAHTHTHTLTHTHLCVAAPGAV